MLNLSEIRMAYFICYVPVSYTNRVRRIPAIMMLDIEVAVYCASNI
jgi:hypothetical protein